MLFHAVPLWASALGISILLLSPIAGPAQPTSSASTSRSATPKHDSAERRAIVEAVRRRAGLEYRTSRLHVTHLKVSGEWAYFAGTEIVPLARGEWQETDLSIEALLEREHDRWQVVEYWSLPDEKHAPRRRFERRVTQLRERRGIAPSIFPSAR